MNLMECVMHRAGSVEHLEVRIKYLQTAVILVFTDQQITSTLNKVASNLLCMLNLNNKVAK